MLSAGTYVLHFLGYASDGGRPVTVTAEHEAGYLSAGTGQSETVRTLLDIQYPSEAVVGDAIDIRIEVRQLIIHPSKDPTAQNYVYSDSEPPPSEDLRALRHGVNIELSSGALEWGNTDNKRVLKIGDPVPMRLAMAPAATAAGKAVMILRMKDMSANTMSAIDVPQVFIKQNGHYLGAGENDELSLPITILTEFHLGRTLVAYLNGLYGIMGLFGMAWLFEKFVVAWRLYKGTRSPSALPGAGTAAASASAPGPGSSGGTV